MFFPQRSLSSLSLIATLAVSTSSLQSNTTKYNKEVKINRYKVDMTIQQNTLIQIINYEGWWMGSVVCPSGGVHIPYQFGAEISLEDSRCELKELKGGGMEQRGGPRESETNDFPLQGSKATSKIRDWGLGPGALKVMENSSGKSGWAGQWETHWNEHNNFLRKAKIYCTSR